MSGGDAVPTATAPASGTTVLASATTTAVSSGGTSAPRAQADAGVAETAFVSTTTSVAATAILPAGESAPVDPTKLQEVFPDGAGATVNGRSVDSTVSAEPGTTEYSVEAEGVVLRLHVNVGTGSGDLAIGSSGIFVIDSSSPLLSLDVEGLPADAPVEAWLYSDPRLLATARADSSGALHLEVTAPSDIEMGEHHVVVRALRGKSGDVVMSVPVRFQGNDAGTSVLRPLLVTVLMLAVVSAFVIPSSGRRRRRRLPRD